ncbi:invasion associated locus B family protein [Roseibium algae]|uniref:Invasion associated locus B family protein n=1 Tax=Roseibium algae TaxID=3123038 RepID=A0ABU8TFU9_9HYPH
MPKRIKIIAAIAFVMSSYYAAPVAAQQETQDKYWQTWCSGPSRSEAMLSCVTTQSLRIKETGQLLFKVDIAYPAKATDPEFRLQAPLGFFLPGKIKLTVDGAHPWDLDIGMCDKRGCFLQTKLPADMLGAMKSGTQLEIDFAPSADKRQKTGVPLTGFSKAIAAIQ